MTGSDVSWAEALQAVAGVIGIFLTAGALFYAIWSGKKTGEMADRSLQESIENRKDDMMPILSLYNTVSTNAKSGLLNFELTNIGNGPLYDLETNSEGCTIYGVRPNPSDGKTLYEMVCEIDRIRAFADNIFTYTYKDMYGREFSAEQEFSIESDGTITIKGKFKIPQKNG